jgi:hypothetical protein
MQSNMAILRNISVQNACDDLSFWQSYNIYWFWGAQNRKGYIFEDALGLGVGIECVASMFAV